MTVATSQPRAPSNGASAPSKPKFGRSRGVTRAAHKVVIYGPGGIGKTSLAAMAPKPIFADIERSTLDMDVERATGIESWSDLRSWLAQGDFSGIDTIVIDSATKAEEWCVAHVLTNVPNDKGIKVQRLEDYGYGKGYAHVYEEWRKFLADLERHHETGRNVVLVAHEQIALAPNPMGEDFKRFQPRLQSSDKANVMAATKEWADHVFFVCYDTAVKDGKARGEGTRTIYCTESPSRVAKVRALADAPLAFTKGSRALWDRVENKGAGDPAPEL
jgi:hypothetical protein